MEWLKLVPSGVELCSRLIQLYARVAALAILGGGYCLRGTNASEARDQGLQVWVLNSFEHHKESKKVMRWSRI